MTRKQQQADLASALQQAVALHRQGRLAEADSLYASVLARDPRHFDALHWLGVLKLQSGRAGEALDLLSRAVKQNVKSVEAMASLGAALTALQRHDEALEYFDKILAVQPANLDALYNRGVVLMQMRRYQPALDAYEQVLRRSPGQGDALFNRANVLAQLERNEEALAGYDKVLSLAPNFPDALINRGNVLGKLERNQDALASFERALAINPHHVDALANKGTALKQLGRIEESLACYDQALSKNPNYINALFNRANALVMLNRLAEALHSYERALAIDPNHVEALTGRARVLLPLNRMDESIATMERGLALSPNNLELLKLRAHAFERYPKLALALQDYRTILALAPDDTDAISGLTSCLMDVCDWDAVEALFGKMNALVDEGAAVNPSVYLRLQDDPARQLSCAHRYLQAQYPGPIIPLKQSPRPPSQKIRIGYVSPDFRQHALAMLIPDMFERHDRDKFDITAISLGPDDGSAIRSRIVSAVDHFHDAIFKSDREIAQLLQDNGIDIAVDLAGTTAHARLGIFAYRAAPIQSSYLGYCATTGSDFIDYILADPVALPFDQQPFYSEAIVHLPECFMVNDSRQPVAAAATRRAAGLPEQGFVFCCFNQAYKYTAPVFGVWMRLLQQVDGSVLWLSGTNDLANENLRKAAERAGVDPGRIVFAAKVPGREDYLARYAAADLFLDTLPYNAHSTACDALWAGLPIVTCRGKSFVGCVGASLLSAIGLSELVSPSLADYETLALSLARDPARHASIKERLAANRLSHPLFDTARLTRHIEAAYTTMWQRFQRGEPAASFAVPSIG